jgi:hypothetical protein
MDGNYGVRGAARSCTEPHLEENKLGARGARAAVCAPLPCGLVCVSGGIDSRLDDVR